MVGDAGMSVQDQVARSAAEFGPDFDPTPLTLAMTLYRTMAEFDRAQAAELAPEGLNLSQFNMLSVLHRAGAATTMGNLAESVSVRPTNLTGLVDGLVKRGLVARELNPDDRRSFLVRISPAGEDFMAQFLPSHWRWLDDLTSGLSPRKRSQLIKLLERLSQSVQDYEKSGAAGSNAAPSANRNADTRPGRADLQR